MRPWVLRVGPVSIGFAAVNIFNPGVVAGGVNSPSGNLRGLLKHFRIVNSDVTDGTISLYLGASGGTAAGTEEVWSGTTVPANSFLDYYANPALKVDVTDFLVGKSSLNGALVLTIEGEIDLV